MHAMMLDRPGEPLRLADIDPPAPAADQVLVRVRACGVCRTDLHIADGDLPAPKLPLILGHEIVGEVVAMGAAVTRCAMGQRVGIPWLASSCGTCRFCAAGRENLCDQARFTGYTVDGGYAAYTLADARYCLAMPESQDATAAAPLLCAGLIGYRTYRMAGSGVRRLGIYGFGAAAHIVAQIAVFEGCTVFAFTRPGDTAAQAFARQLGAAWAGDSTTAPPEPLDAALIFAPVGSLLPAALAAVVKGGTVVCGGIHMSDIPAFPYRLLWEERVVRSVANLTRQDGEEFLALAPRIPVRTAVEPLPLAQANLALERLRRGEVQGAAVLVPE